MTFDGERDCPEWGTNYEALNQACQECDERSSCRSATHVYQTKSGQPARAILAHSLAHRRAAPLKARAQRAAEEVLEQVEMPEWEGTYLPETRADGSPTHPMEELGARMLAEAIRHGVTAMMKQVANFFSNLDNWWPTRRR